MADCRVNQSINYLTEGSRDMEIRNYSPRRAGWQIWQPKVVGSTPILASNYLWEIKQVILPLHASVSPSIEIEV